MRASADSWRSRRALARRLGCAWQSPHRDRGDDAGADWLAAEAAALGAGCDDRGIRGRAARPCQRLSGNRRRAHPGDPGLRCAGHRRDRRRRPARTGRRATPRSSSPNCRRRPSMTTITSGCAARRAPRLCHPVRRATAPVWRRSMPSGFAIRSGPRRSMFRARRERRCSPPRRAAPRRGWSPKAAGHGACPQCRRLARWRRAAGAGPPLVVMTPRSSWWQSTAERGGGIVCWLECLRALLAAAAGRGRSCSPPIPATNSVISGSTSFSRGVPDGTGKRPRAARPGCITAPISARPAGRCRLCRRMTICASWRPPSWRGPARRTRRRREEQVPNGETRDIHLAGGRYLTLVGDNELFHLPQDRWPDAVDVAAMTRIAAAARASC